MTDSDRKLLRDILKRLKAIERNQKWIILTLKMAQCGFSDEGRKEKLAIGQQLPELSKDIIDYAKIGHALFVDRKKGIKRE